MIKRLLIAVVLLGGTFGGIFYIKHLGTQQMSQGGYQSPPTTISSAVAELESWRPSISSVGGLSSTQGIMVTPEVSGVIKELAFESGQDVVKGQLLLRLDDAVDRAALQVLVAESRLAEVQFQRAKELLPKRALSQSEFDASQANAEAARARVAQQEAIIERKSVRAPFAGALGIRQVDAGQYIEPGDSVVSLQSLDPMYLDYALPERFLPSLAVGQDVEVSVGAYPGDVFLGRLEAIEPDVDVGTRMVRLRAALPNPSGKLRPGMFARVVNMTEGTVEAVTVPRTAVSLNTYGDFLYLVEDDGKGGLVARRQQIASGEVRGGRIVIESGLAAGQTVVRTGLVKLRDGMPIAVDNSVELNDERLDHQ